MNRDDAEVIVAAQGARPMGQAALPTLDCAISAGDRVLILGADLAQLAAYMKVLAAMEPSAGGQVSVCGQDSAPLDSAARRALRTRVGYVLADAPLLSVLSGRQNLLLAARYHEMADDDSLQKRAQALLATMPDQAQHDSLPAFMSQRLRRMLALARPLMLQPSLVFIENPLLGLSHADRALVCEFLLGQQRESDLALVISSDDLLFAKQSRAKILYCDAQSVLFFESFELLLRRCPASLKRMAEQQSVTFTSAFGCQSDPLIDKPSSRANSDSIDAQ